LTLALLSQSLPYLVGDITVAKSFEFKIRIKKQTHLIDLETSLLIKTDFLSDTDDEVDDDDKS
jgi:hypothetical protein